MACCLHCQGEIDPKALFCPHCGHDFRSGSPSAAPPRMGLAYSTLGTVALVAGLAAAAVRAVTDLVMAISACGSGRWLTGLVWLPLNVLLMLAMFVVFARVLDADR